MAFTKNTIVAKQDLSESEINKSEKSTMMSLLILQEK